MFRTRITTCFAHSRAQVGIVVVVIVAGVAAAAVLCSKKEPKALG